ncbi:hypothetical protein L21SP2_1436 [Salinispira pacifica]|uniref:Uncharacterized protein n=1 Tax=Salinispira pacifica TaxID=1307761 RepID=V5WGB6_9SPIO|nr:hypothetical protein L21SP2_1436 [Salinispira pacifica]
MHEETGRQFLSIRMKRNDRGKNTENRYASMQFFYSMCGHRIYCG